MGNLLLRPLISGVPTPSALPSCSLPSLLPSPCLPLSPWPQSRTLQGRDGAKEGGGQGMTGPQQGWDPKVRQGTTPAPWIWLDDVLPQVERFLKRSSRQWEGQERRLGGWEEPVWKNGKVPRLDLRVFGTVRTGKLRPREGWWWPRSSAGGGRTRLSPMDSVGLGDCRLNEGAPCPPAPRSPGLGEAAWRLSACRGSCLASSG